MQAGRFGSAWQCAATRVGAATVKLELQLSVVHPSPASNVKLRVAPLQCAVAGNVGMLAELFVGLQPPVTLNPAFQVL